MTTFKVIKIRRGGQQQLVSEHYWLEDAERKAGFIRGAVITDDKGKVVPYELG